MKNISIETGDLFHDLWKNLNDDQFIDSINLIKKRFKINNFKDKNFKNKIVLDVGCGSGRWCVLASLLKAKKVIGIDSSKKNINYNKKKFIKYSNIYFKYGESAKLKIKNNFSDITISYGVAHHTVDMFKSINELIRVTKKGGIILLLVYGDGGFRWNLIKKLRPIAAIIGKNNMINCMKKSKLPANNIKHFVDDFFVPIQLQTNLDHLLNFLQYKTLKTKVWNKYKTLDQEENIESYLKDIYKIKNFFNYIKNNTLKKLSLKIINSYLKEINVIKNSKLSVKKKRFLIIGEGNHRLEIIK
tara:strand:- start:158 stop:1060 length:903 start_codon:yes stop_codon:yes gene_type:complete